MNIEERYGIIYENGKRYYICDLKEEHWDIEHTIPYMLSVEGNKIYRSSWKHLIVALLEYLDGRNPKTREELLRLSNDWNGKKVFSQCLLTNYSEFKGIYVNTNNNSIRALLTIQLLLAFYNVDVNKCELWIKRHPAVEPKEVREIIENKTKNDFIEFYRIVGLNEGYIRDLIEDIDVLNKYLKKSSPQFDNFYLFDDVSYYGNYRCKFLEYIYQRYTDKLNRTKRVLSFLTFFYKNRKYLEEIKREDYSKKSIIDLLKDLLDFSFNISGKDKVDCNDLYAAIKNNSRFPFAGTQDLYDGIKLLLGKQYKYKYPFIMINQLCY